MKRKLIYGVGAALIGLAVVAVLLMPSSTRETFFSEFAHRTKLMLGIKPAPIAGADGSQGLRLEHPDEYGMGHEPADADQAHEDQ